MLWLVFQTFHETLLCSLRLILPGVQTSQEIPLVVVLPLYLHQLLQVFLSALVVTQQLTLVRQFLHTLCLVLLSVLFQESVSFCLRL